MKFVFDDLDDFNIRIAACSVLFISLQLYFSVYYYIFNLHDYQPPVMRLRIRWCGKIKGAWMAAYWTS